MQTLGIIGSGMIGSQVARLATAANMNVIISNSRGPETLSGFVRELGPLARAATTEALAAEADIIVIAIPFVAYSRLSPEMLAGKTVIDTMNYYPERDGELPEVKTAEIASSELVQAHLKHSFVVRAVNNMDWVRLFTRARLPGSADRSALPVAANAEHAKSLAIALLDSLGYDAVDMGALADSWRSEPTMPAYVIPYIGTIPRSFDDTSEREWFLKAPGATVSADALRKLLARAIRHDRMFGTTASLAGASL